MRSNGWEPLEPYPGAMSRWRCLHVACGNEASPRYAQIQQRRAACRTCASEAKRRAFSLDPEEAASFMRSKGYEPLVPYPGSNNRPWLCRHLECGREVSPRYAGIQQGQGGCKPCHQDRLARLYQTSPEVAADIVRARGYEPLEEFPGTIHAKWRLRHIACGRIVEPALSNIRNAKGTGCAYCSRHRIDPDDAVAMMRAADLEPLDPFVRSDRPWRCIHKACGREVQPRLNGIQQGQGGCPTCGRGVISHQAAAEVFAKADLIPLEPFPGSASRWRCIHSACGREVQPFYSNVQRSGSGCIYCSDSTFDYIGPGVVYLLRNDDFYSLKVGITSGSSRVDRIAEHRRHGWNLVEKWTTLTGKDAAEIEAEILNWWRYDLNAPPSVHPTEMPSGGWTETIALIYVEVEMVSARIQSLIQARITR